MSADISYSGSEVSMTFSPNQDKSLPKRRKLTGSKQQQRQGNCIGIENAVENAAPSTSDSALNREKGTSSRAPLAAVSLAVSNQMAHLTDQERDLSGKKTEIFTEKRTKPRIKTTVKDASAVSSSGGASTRGYDIHDSNDVVGDEIRGDIEQSDRIDLAQRSSVISRQKLLAQR